MLHISFAMTSDAFADCSKTETRRFWKPAHAAKFKPGTVFMGITKDFRAGGKRMHPARVLECYRERLGDMSGYSFAAEGGTRYWADRAAYIEAMGGPDNVPYVLRFEHLPNVDTCAMPPLVMTPCGATMRNGEKCRMPARYEVVDAGDAPMPVCARHQMMAATMGWVTRVVGASE